MRPKIIIAIILIAVGIVALAYQGITYVTREKVVDIGPLEGTSEKTNTIPLPPPFLLPGPPQLVVMPETNVYAVPDVDVDVFFYGGWWWRPWEGRWYRSQRYDSGWSHYQGTPSFHRSVPSGWRNDYKQRRWKGQQWDHQRVPHQQAQQNWSRWEKDRHWEKQNNWGVRGLKKTQAQSKQPSRKVQPRQSQPQSRDGQRRP